MTAKGTFHSTNNATLKVQSKRLKQSNGDSIQLPVRGARSIVFEVVVIGVNAVWYGILPLAHEPHCRCTLLHKS